MRCAAAVIALLVVFFNGCDAVFTLQNLQAASNDTCGRNGPEIYQLLNGQGKLKSSNVPEHQLLLFGMLGKAFP